MRKIIAAINMTIDGFCDHTGMIPDDEVHDHYKELLLGADTILYGRITYQLMEFWPTLLQNPSNNKAMNDFAVAIDQIDKVVFSQTWMKKPEAITWRNTRLASRTIKDEIEALKRQPGKDILVGSPSLIVSALNLGLLDELQLCVHPVIAGSGLPLFKNVSDRVTLQLLKTKMFRGGALIAYYAPLVKD